MHFSSIASTSSIPSSIPSPAIAQQSSLEYAIIKPPLHPVCGNGLLDPFEQCDNGRFNSDAPGSCRTNCILPSCGDRIKDPHEQCDDGNNIETDHCTSSCVYTPVPTGFCGDGILQPERGEQCDNGNKNALAPSACRTNCLLPYCGDGIIDLSEQCDDSNAVSNDGCSTFCEIERASSQNIVYHNAPLVSDQKAEVRNQKSEVRSQWGGYTAGQVGGYTAGNPWGGTILPTSIPPATQTRTGSGLVILIATGAAAGIGYVRRRR